MRKAIRGWWPTQRVMRSAVLTTTDLLRAEVITRVSGPEHDVWRGRYQQWARRILEIYGLDVHQYGQLPQPTSGRGMLLLSSHRSPLDVVVLVSLMPHVRFLSRADVERWPVVGSAAKRAGTVFVERGNRKSALRSVEQMREVLQTEQTLVVFPEGTTKTDSTIARFQSGAFRAQEGLEIDIWVAGLAYPEGFGWGRQGEGLLDHLKTVARSAPTQVVVGFEKLPTLPGSHQEAARFSREKLQDLDQLLHAQRKG